MALGDTDKGQTRASYWLQKLHKILQSLGGNSFYGEITTATSTTQFKVESLAGIGTDLLNDAYYCQIIQADAAAPEGEIQKVSAFDSSDGDITVGTAYTVAPAVGDYVLILHESAAKMFLIADGTGAYPESVADNSILGHILAIDGDVSDYDDNIHSLEAIGAAVAATNAGELQISPTTIDLNQAAASYDLFTGTSQDVILESLVLRVPAVDVSDDATITGISIQTDDTTPQVLISSAMGLKAVLTAEAQVAWNPSGVVLIKTGSKIQLTIYGGAADAATVCDVVAGYRAVVSGGSLA